jgi:uncharacterized protein YjbJ (UPF0337 family)
MNENIVEGQWKMIRGEVKKQWGKLTDDELDQAEGNRDKLVGLLQKKYGYTQEKAQQEYDDFVNTWSRSGV